jgi:hypothetical protein
MPHPAPPVGSVAWLAWQAKFVAWLHSLQAAGVAKLNAAVAADITAAQTAALKTRPLPTAAPADQHTWLQSNASKFNDDTKPGGVGGPEGAYPEFHWTRTGNGKEARAFVSRSSQDYVHWYQGPTGATWSYDHHWGSSGFDAIAAVSSAWNATTQAVSDAGHVIQYAVDTTGNVVHTLTAPLEAVVQDAENSINSGIDTLERDLPPQCTPLLEGLKSGVHYIAQQAESAVDPTRIDWEGVAHQVEAVTSVVPGLGTALSDVVATAEVLYDVLRSGNLLEAALRAAYDYALASVPGAAALKEYIDPVFTVLVDIVVKGQKPTAAIIAAAVAQAPTTPGIGKLNPRSIAASLATFVASKMGLA